MQVVAVGQLTVARLAAVALMAEDAHPRPAYSMMLMAGGEHTARVVREQRDRRGADALRRGPGGVSNRGSCRCARLADCYSAPAKGEAKLAPRRSPEHRRNRLLPDRDPPQAFESRACLGLTAGSGVLPDQIMNAREDFGVPTRPGK